MTSLQSKGGMLHNNINNSDNRFKNMAPESHDCVNKTLSFQLQQSSGSSPQTYNSIRGNSTPLYEIYSVCVVF